jgi:hypothetical protein
MTETEWLAAMKPTPMLEFLRDKVSDRKLRLLGCGCCRRIWHLLLDKRGQRAVELAEQSADYPVPPRQLDAASAESWEAYEDSLGNGNQDTPAGMTWAQLADANRAASYASNEQITEDILLEVLETVTAANEGSEHAFLIRDIFGNPFHPVVADLSWLTSTVVALASGIYEERAFDRLPILADALMDAGCENADIMEHCRGPGPHVRGCWVIDLLLGKE